MKFLIVLTLLAAAVFSQVPGASKEHKGPLTNYHLRAIDLVLRELGDRYGQPFKLIKVHSLHEQIVAGKNYFLNMMVSCPAFESYDVEARIHHNLQDNMEIMKMVEKGHHTGAKYGHEDVSTPEMKRALDVAIKYLNVKYEDDMQMIKMNSIHTQIVSGAFYHFDMNVKGKKMSERRMEVVVHHRLDDRMEVLKAEEKPLDKVSGSWWDVVSDWVASLLHRKDIIVGK
jgi:hypothetical protein